MDATKHLSITTNVVPTWAIVDENNKVYDTFYRRATARNEIHKLEKIYFTSKLKIVKIKQKPKDL